MIKLIVAALPEEEREILAELGSLPNKTIKFGKGIEKQARIFNETNGSEIIVVQSGMGPVNAALSLILVCQYHPVDTVYLLGVAGALRTELSIGDLIVADHVVQHDYYSSLQSGHFRMKPGFLVLDESTGRSHDVIQPASDRLAAQLCDPVKNLKPRRGGIASGNEFVGTTERKRAIGLLHPDLLVVDMEAAGIAQVAQMMNIPFIIAKTVADRLTPDGSIEQDFVKCLEFASRNAARVVHAIRE